MGLLGRTAAAVMGALVLESAIVKVIWVGIESRESRQLQCDRCWELVVSNAGWLGAALGIKPIPSAKVHVPQYQKVEAASKDSRTIIIRPHSRF